MKNLKIFLTIVLVATLLIVVSTVSYATEGPSFNFIRDEGNNNTTNTTNNTVNNTVFNNITNSNNTNTTNNTTNNTVNNTTNNATNNSTYNNNTNNSSYNNTDLPKAGAGDNVAIFVIIAVFGVSALYAYKKIREYNVR